MQQPIAPVARILGPLHEMRVVVSDHASDVNLRLQSALSVFGAVFVDMARIHAAIVAVKGHRFLVLDEIDFRHGSIRCGSPVSFSHCNRCNNRRDNTDRFQMLFEINSIFFIFTYFWDYILSKKVWVASNISARMKLTESLIDTSDPRRISFNIASVDLSNAVDVAPLSITTL